MNTWRVPWSTALAYPTGLWLSLILWLAILAPAFCAAASPAAPARLHLLEARLTPPEVHPGVYAKLYSPKTATLAPYMALMYIGRGMIRMPPPMPGSVP